MLCVDGRFVCDMLFELCVVCCSWFVVCWLLLLVVSCVCCLCGVCCLLCECSVLFVGC